MAELAVVVGLLVLALGLLVFALGLLVFALGLLVFAPGLVGLLMLAPGRRVAVKCPCAASRG